MSDACPSGGTVPEPAKSTPTVWRWYVVYCSGMVALYLVVAACGVILLVVDPVELDMEAMLAKLLGAFNLGFGILLVGLFGAAPFLPPKPWTWIYGIVCHRDRPVRALLPAGGRAVADLLAQARNQSVLRAAGRVSSATARIAGLHPYGGGPNQMT